MPMFGSRSRSRLLTCDPRIQLICNVVIDTYDFTIIWGFRGKEDQNDCFDRGTSTKMFPNSKHNIAPSIAVDIAPWHDRKPHIRWNNNLEFVQLSGRFLQAADALKVKIRWGGDWDMDSDLYDFNKPFDLGHFEVMV